MSRACFKLLRFFAIGMVVLSQVHSSAGLADAAKDNETLENKPSVIVDLSAPPGHLTDQQKREWEKQQQKIWGDVLTQSAYQDRGDTYFRAGKYHEALQEYLKALEESAIKPEVFMARERLAWTYVRIGGVTGSAMLK